MHQHQVAMLKEMMKYNFAAVELNLYLDTHPADQKALADYNYFVQKYNTLKAHYEACYGPLLNLGHSCSQYPWRWVDEPWPWEICY